MSDTYKDPIVENLHVTRHAILARHGNDFSAYAAVVAERRIPGMKYVATEAYSNCKVQKAS